MMLALWAVTVVSHYDVLTPLPDSISELDFSIPPGERGERLEWGIAEAGIRV